MRNRIALLVAGLLAVVVLPGCVIGRVYRDQPLDEGKIAAIQRGQTTKQEILDLFGPPQEIDAREITAIGVPFEPFISRRGDKPPVERIVAARYFRYTYTRANAMAIILILFNYGEFDQKSDNLVVFFDGDNKVEDFAFRRDTDQLPRYGFWSR
jgi:outer membrane protein assembly factor BamE (lipoprotein component of BamABCDE complex)